MDFANFKPCLLIAMPELSDPNFSKSLVLLTDYQEEGAYGFVINRSTTLTLGEALSFSKGDMVEGYQSYPLYWGGPVDQKRIWILYDQKAYLKVKGDDLGDEVSLAEEGQILIDESSELLQNEMKVFHGAAAWGAKELESEIVRSFWITAPLSKEIIFETPVDEMWEKAVENLGIDPKHLQGGPHSQILN